MSRLDDTPDLIVMLGDAASGMETKAHFSAKILANAACLSGGKIDVTVTDAGKTRSVRNGFRGMR